MPIYPYRCEACAHEFETLQRIGDAPMTECPKCGEARLRKLLTAAAFRLKGSGWYETDFKNKDKKPAKEATSGDKDGGGDAKKDGEKKTADGAGAKDAASGAKTESKTAGAAKTDG